MTDEDNKIIWFIDNDEHQLRVYKRHLERGIRLFGEESNKFVVNDVLAKPHKEEYFFIFDEPNTSAILIDQKMLDKGGVDHSGIELAQYLRALNNLIPIYILTNYPAEEEYVDNEWNVEAILDKGKISDDDVNLKTIIARIFRRVTNYHKVFGERERRFRELLKKSLQGKLSEEEKIELEELEFTRSIFTLARENADSFQPSKLDKALEKIEELKNMINIYKSEE